MAALTSDRASKARPDEVRYPGKSPWKVCSRLVLFALLFGAVATAFAASEEFRTKLRVQPTASRWAAGLSGGFGTLLLVCAAWQWHGRLRWVAISPAGLNWHSGWGVKFQKWNQFDRIERGTIETSVYGEELKTGRYVDVLFKSGPSLRVGTHNIYGYENLVAEIQVVSGSTVRIFVPAGNGSNHRTPVPGTVLHGPLRIDNDGLQWDSSYYRWDEIENYEVAYGMLRIQPVHGPEFLRRVIDLGEWQSAVARLDRNCGSRRVGAAKAMR